MPKKKKPQPQPQPQIDLSLLDRLTHPHAAGIDVGAEELVVAVPPDRAVKFVRTFGSFTSDLHALRTWLEQCGIQTVALESTGNYWVPIYQLLEEAGLEVCLINPRDVKGIGGRKTDVADAQWLQQLHAAGLLRKSFRPVKEIAALRYLMRHRSNLIQSAARELQHMQKTLNECNLQVHHVFSDLDGASAQRILKAILAGERDPQKLAALRDKRCRTALPKVLQALEGDYRAEYLFVLGQNLACWQQTQTTLRALDAQIKTLVAAIQVEPAAPAQGAEGAEGALPKRPGHKNSPAFDVFAEAHRFYGVDLAQIPGIASSTLSVFMSELGTGAQLRTAFKSAKAFCAWLGVCPENQISGGKILLAKTRKTTNRVAAALRLSAQALGHAKGRLGDFSRRMKGRLGKAEGITATAHKLARIVYAMLTTKQNYDEAKAFALTPAKKARRIQQLLAQAAALGLQLAPATSPAI
jgi:transposase